RCYRDSRINRIFEGTNEINRMVCADMLLKQAKKADSRIFTDSGNIYSGIDTLQAAWQHTSPETSYMDYSCKVIENFKKTVLLIMGRAYEILGKQYSQEQEV
ncbi:MAG TPA: hypothetical protein PLL90_12565, partial [Bacteroidales bacterium]|nr:hypothetical protein [Bacteroidales bacterium]